MILVTHSIGLQMKYDVERKMGTKYTRYDVNTYINEGAKYCFRVSGTKD